MSRLGGDTIDLIQNASLWSFEFAFGCQSSETGLFRTQNIDGIMGMSASAETFPQQLYYSKVTSSKIFAMCFKVGGGILTLGGVDQSIHTSSIQYAINVKKSGWYTVKLLDIFMTNNTNQSYPVRLVAPREKYNRGKGTIVDSGTTDTYLPSAIRNQFLKLFQSLTGTKLTNSFSHLNKHQIQRLPVLIFRIQAVQSTTTGVENPTESNSHDSEDNNNYIDIPMPPQNYLELNRGRYASRIYLTEDEGVVLGANFMNEQNIIFDMDNQRVGFAKSRCDYNEVGTKKSTTTTANSNNIDNNNKSMYNNLMDMFTYSRFNKSSQDSLSNNHSKKNMKKIEKNKQNHLNIGEIKTNTLDTVDTRVHRKSKDNNNSNKGNKNNKNIPRNLFNCTIPYPALIPISPCTAVCTANSTLSNTINNTDAPVPQQQHHQSSQKIGDSDSYIAFGDQQWSSYPFDCPINRNTRNSNLNNVNRKQRNEQWNKPYQTIKKTCNVSCSGGDIVGGNPLCPDTPWSECQYDCTQHRKRGVYSPSTSTSTTGTAKGTTGGSCRYERQHRECSIFQCPIHEKDRVLAIELRIRQLNTSQWSYVRTEDLIKAISALLSNYVMPVSTCFIIPVKCSERMIEIS